LPTIRTAATRPSARCRWRAGRAASPARKYTCHARHVEQRISLVTLGVTDLTRARRFYETLGWSGAQQPDDEVCFFQAGGMVFGLWTALGGHGAPGIELAYNARSPQEVDVLLADAAERPGHSRTPMATCGKWPTTPDGPSTQTDLSRSDRCTSDPSPADAREQAIGSRTRPEMWRTLWGTLAVWPVNDGESITVVSAGSIRLRELEDKRRSPCATPGRGAPR